jgi:hypothetical protein
LPASCQKCWHLQWGGFQLPAQDMRLAEVHPHAPGCILTQGSPTDPLAGNETSFRQQVSQITYPDGNPVSLLSVFGGTTYAATNPSR